VSAIACLQLAGRISDKAEGVQLASIINSDITESYGVVTLGKVAEGRLKKPVEVLKQGKGFIEKFFYQISLYRCYERELDGLSERVAY
jgi:catalase